MTSTRLLAYITRTMTPDSSPTHRIIGHTTLRKRLTHLNASGKLPHALLFGGPAGVGKFLLARHLAARLLCNRAQTEHTADKIIGNEQIGELCANCKSCTLVASGNHPDLHILNLAEKDQAAIESLRDLLSKLSLGSFLGGARVVILREIDSLTVQASNLLLKTLEEPRAGVYYIATCSNTMRLLQTIRSRCQEWGFELMSNSEIFQALQIIYPDGDPDNLRGSARLCDGSLELAPLIDPSNSGEQLAIWKDVVAALDACFKGEIEAGLKLAEKIGRNKGMQPMAFIALRVHCRERMLNSSAPSDQRRWAFALQNALSAETLTAHRNINLAMLLQCLVTNLCPYTTPDSLLAVSPDASLVENLVV